MYSECSFVMLIKSLYLVSKTNFRTFRFADGYGSWIICRSNFVRHYGCSYPHVHRLVRRSPTLCQVWDRDNIHLLKANKKCCTLWSFFLGLVFRKTEASLTQPILVWWTFPWWKTLSQPLKQEVRNNENLWGIHRWSLLITALHWQILQVGKCQTHHLSEPLIPPFLFHPSTTILLMHALHTIDFMREIRYIKSVLLVHYY